MVSDVLGEDVKCERATHRKLWVFDGANSKNNEWNKFVRAVPNVSPKAL